jgi:hypothetical protein
MNGDARTGKDVKNEGRTDYVYESTASSDKKYFRKAAFEWLSARGRQRHSAIFCRRYPARRIPPERRMTPAVGKFPFSAPTDFDGTLLGNPAPEHVR